MLCQGEHLTSNTCCCKKKGEKKTFSIIKFFSCPFCFCFSFYQLKMFFLSSIIHRNVWELALFSSSNVCTIPRRRTHIWIGRRCAAGSSRPIPIFRGNFSENRYPYLGKGTYFLQFCNKKHQIL